MENEVVKNEVATQVQPQPSIAHESFYANISVVDVIITIGVPAVVGCLIYIGRKLQILEDLKLTVDKIKGNVKVVSDYLVKNHNKFDPAELRAYSPILLTEQGQQFIRTIGFDNVFKERERDFFGCIDSEKPKLKYDVEAAAIKSIHILYEKPYMDFLKVYLYNNPKRSIENIAPTLGVYVRDKYLEKHPEITQ
jgi:hypothetical protein